MDVCTVVWIEGGDECAFVVGYTTFTWSRRKNGRQRRRQEMKNNIRFRYSLFSFVLICFPFLVRSSMRLIKFRRPMSWKKSSLSSSIGRVESCNFRVTERKSFIIVPGDHVHTAVFIDFP